MKVKMQTLAAAHAYVWCVCSVAVFLLVGARWAYSLFLFCHWLLSSVAWGNHALGIFLAESVMFVH